MTTKIEFYPEENKILLEDAEIRLKTKDTNKLLALLNVIARECVIREIILT